jgi:hypothetical protein
MDWSNEINTNSLNFEDGQYVSVVSEFVDQVRSCIKSTSLRFEEDPILSTSSTLLLLEDLPNIANLGAREKVHSVLEEYISAREASSSIVIIISDTTFSNSSFSNDMPITKRSFIPINVLKSSKFTEISFNPIAKTFLAKTLSNICQKERYLQRSKELVEDISVNCEGDIRKAINYLQFYGLKQSSNSISELKRDEMSMYQILGKIIYNKRDEIMADAELQLDGDKSPHQRKLLSFNPEETISSGQLSYSTLSLFLNQNYTNQANTLEEVIQVSEYLSLSDVYAGYWDSDNTMDKYATSIAARGTLFSWDPTLPRKSSGYKGFVKPEYWNSKKTEADFKRTWTEVYIDLM